MSVVLTALLLINSRTPPPSVRDMCVSRQDKLQAGRPALRTLENCLPHEAVKVAYRRIHSATASEHEEAECTTASL